MKIMTYLKCGLAISMATTADCRSLEPLERIGIETGEGGAQFVLKESGKPFYVTGFNYIRLRSRDGRPGGDHSTFDADTEFTQAAYEPDRAEAMFQTLEDAGYNTVRVFIIGRNSFNPGIGGDYTTTQGLYEPYMENVLDFLRRATRHNIRVFPTFGDGELPNNAYYLSLFGAGNHEKNLLVLSKNGVDARVEYITSFLAYLKTKEPAVLPTLLGLQCQNEAYLRANQFPFSETKGSFTAANGKSYDLSSRESRQALMDEGYRYYYKRMVEAVKAIDPEMLVAEGVFVPAAVGKDPKEAAGLWPAKYRDKRYPPTLTSLGESPLDFLDVHFYRHNGRQTVEAAFKHSLASTGFFAPEMAVIRKSKPVIVGEFGAFDFMEKTFEEALDNMVIVRDLAQQVKVNGMLFWTYDCHEQAKLWHATEDWNLFLEKMGTFEDSAAE